MSALDASDGRMELEGKKGQDTSTHSESEGYIADDETRPGPTMMQKLAQRASDYENHLKGKESSDKEDPHPELSYIPPGDGKEGSGAELQEGKQHGGAPVVAHGNDVHKGAKTHFASEGADEPTTIEKLTEKFWEAENHMKGKETSAVEDPHPELAYITPTPQEEKPGFFSRMGHKFGGQEHESKKETSHAAGAPTKFDEGVQPAPEEAEAAVNKGVGSSELGTGYEEDGEETINPAVVPKGKEPKTDATNRDGDTHSDAKIPGTVEHVRGDYQAASENETKSGDETLKKPGFFSRLLGGKKQDD